MFLWLWVKFLRLWQQAFCVYYLTLSNTTNAMEAMDTINKDKNSTKHVVVKNSDITNSKENKVLKDAEEVKKDGEKDDGDGKKNPDGEKNYLRWVIPVATGVGGFAIGFVFGKFVF